MLKTSSVRTEMAALGEGGVRSVGRVGRVELDMHFDLLPDPTTPDADLQLYLKERAVHNLIELLPSTD
jgi:hypothetical protein